MASRLCAPGIFLGGSEYLSKDISYKYPKWGYK